jgi:hypothetical protein
MIILRRTTTLFDAVLMTPNAKTRGRGRSVRLAAKTLENPQTRKVDLILAFVAGAGVDGLSAIM